MPEEPWRLWGPAVTAAGSVGVLLLAATWIQTPGYTDADYYMATAVRLAEGKGLSEPFLWNFLSGLSKIPHPSHLYWMPMASFAAALPMTLLGTAFAVAQIAFILVGLSIPWLTAAVARRLGATDRQRWLAAWLAIFPGFFLPFLVTTDVFGLYALFAGGALLLVAGMVATGNWRRAVVAGLVIGLAHLTRADGFLLLLPAGLSLLRWRKFPLRLGGALLLGYLIVMGPWMARLFVVSGSVLPPGGTATAWLRSYDELFTYPATDLNPAHLLSAGAGELVQVRARAFGQNLLSFFGVNGLVFLAPFMLWGGWARRKRPIVYVSAVYATSLFLLMTVLFPHPGTRGGFFHSSAGLMPVLWPLAILGLDDVLDRIGPTRSWRIEEAKGAFGLGAVLIAAVVTGFLFWTRVARPAGTGSGWNSSAIVYGEITDEIREIDEEGGLVAVNNPPGFWLASGLPSVVIPDGGEDALWRVARDFGVEWVVLEFNHPVGLNAAYEDPGSLTQFEYIATIDPRLGPPVHILGVGP